jgi:hypothetical protein
VSPLLRKPRHVGRADGRHRDARFIVIACEDTLIQEAYFDLFRSPKVQLWIIPPTDCKSSPGYILGGLDVVRRSHDWETSDEFWLSIDTDRWPAKKLGEVQRVARQKGYKVVVSNPCFEFWLLLHLLEVTAPLKRCDEAVELMKTTCGGYSKKRVPEGLATVETVRQAIQRAIATDTHPDGWPTENGTQVYRLAERLLELGADVLPGAR